MPKQALQSSSNGTERKSQRGVPMKDLDPYINDFATRSFRNTADMDYIAARASYRMELYPQFLWSGLQAIEKYLKGILLYNRVPKPEKKYIGHDLGEAMALASQSLPFKIELSKPSLEIIEHLDTYGRFRYLETPYHVRDHELLKLDRAVWELRPYCRVLNYQIDTDEKKVAMLPLLLDQIRRSREEPIQRIAIPGGELEKILAKKTHPARANLVWKNLYFNGHKRKQVQWRSRMHATNSPLSLNPELLDEILKYVFLPKEVVAAYAKERDKLLKDRRGKRA